MRWFSEIRERLRGLLSAADEERQTADELRFHLEMQVEENVRRGMTPKEARRQAALRLGGVAQVREATRDARGLRWLDDLAGDARHALRTLRRRPAFTAAAVATLALGIGGTTAVFGIVDALFLRPPAGVAAPDDVVRLYVVRDEGSWQSPEGGPGSYLDYEALRDGARGFAGVAATFIPASVDLGRGEGAERVNGLPVTWNYFSLLGVRPARGRFFLPEEDSIAGAHPAAVLSHGFWQRRFGGDPEIVGRPIVLNGQAVTVVGVAQPGFTGIDPEPVDVWVPLAMASPLAIMIGGNLEWRRMTGMRVLMLVARLASGVGQERAAASAATALRHAAEALPELDPTPDVRLASLIHARGPQRTRAAEVALLLLFVTAAVLVIACANVANLLLARGTSRRRETAVRASLGAARGRLLRQHLTESVVLALLGGSAGVAVAAGGSLLARRFPLPPAASPFDGRALAFAFGLSLLAGLVFGIAPALRSARIEPVEGLKGGAPGSRPGRGRLRRGLVALQVALSLVLLVGAGLLIRSVRGVYAIDPGLDVGRLIVVSVDLGNADHEGPARQALYAEARDRVLRVPGIERAALAQFTPLGGFSMSVPIAAAGLDTASLGEDPLFDWVGPGYFETIGTRVLRGREFDERDRAGGEPVAVIDETMARLLAPGGDALGRCIAVAQQMGDGGCTRVVGIVEAMRERYLEAPAVPKIYLPRRGGAVPMPNWVGPALLARASGSPADLVPQVRAAMQEVAADLPYVDVRPLAEHIRPQILPYRLGAMLFSLFGALALVLAAVGLYGVLGYFVAERTAEIGIRRSLGAREGTVIGLVVRQGMLPVAVGLGLGVGAALAAGRLLDAILYDVAPRDPATIGVVAVLLAVVSLVASYVPARRAAGVDPMVALRAE